MSQWFDALATLPEDSCLVPSTYVVTQPLITPVPGDLMHCTHVVCIFKAHKYTKYFKTSKIYQRLTNVPNPASVRSMYSRINDVTARDLPDAA